MKINIVTLFPEMFDAITGYGVTGRSIKKGLVELGFYNPRDYANDRHRTVDDRPYGGGPGMVMMVEPLRKALEAAQQPLSDAHKICLSPQGRKLDQAGVRELQERNNLILVAGRYEGIDERFIASDIDEEWSIGDYVLSGGELAAMVLIDSLIRLIPGALGHGDSASEDSFYAGLLDYPHYTRPEEVTGYAGQEVPGILLSGNHVEIERWRLKQSLGRTWARRPDLLEARQLSNNEQQLLEEYRRELENPGSGGTGDNYEKLE